MPPPRILGQNATTPGMLDVETADGMRRSIPAWMAPRLGLSADLVAGDAAARELQPAPAPQMADNSALIQAAQGTLATPPARRPRQAPVTVDVGEPTMVDEAAVGALRGAQDAAVGTMAGGGAVTNATGSVLQDVGAAVDDRVARIQAAQEAAGAEADAAAARVSQERTQTTDRYQTLSNAAALGDVAARSQLADMALEGDQRAVEAYRRAQVQQQIVGSQGGGRGGGTRLTRTETTQLRQQARPTTEAEAAELQSAAAEQDRAEREGMVALAREAEAEAGALADTASAMQTAQSQLDALERRRQQAERARQAELMRRQRALDTAASEVASRTLDPGRMYAKGETRNRTAAAIALALGGFADAITGGEAGLTTALGIINTAIDRDIEAQRGNVAIAQQGLAAKQSLLDDMRRTFGDQQAAEEATRATMLEGVERQIQALRLNAASDAQRAALDRMLADIQAQKAAARQAAVMGGIPMTDIVIEQRQQVGGGGGRRPTALPDLPGDDVQLAERARLAAEDTAIDESVRSLDRMAELLDEGALVGPIASRLPGRSLSANAREFDRLSTQLTMSMREDVLGPGTVTEGEREMLFNAVGLTSNLPAEDVKRVVRDMRAKLLRRQAAARRSVGQGAVAEAERRAPGEAEAVTRQRGDLATELGGTRR
jgi:hypothetical protein